MTIAEIAIAREMDVLTFLAFGAVDSFDAFTAASAVTASDEAAINAFYGPLDTAQSLRIAAQDAAIAVQRRPTEDEENEWDALYNGYDH